jgi:hypothetical protein
MGNNGYFAIGHRPQATPRCFFRACEDFCVSLHRHNKAVMDQNNQNFQNTLKIQNNQKIQKTKKERK